MSARARRSGERAGFANEGKLILLSAGTADTREAACEHAERLAALVDWPLLIELMRGRRLLALLGPRLQALTGRRASDELGAAVTEALESGRRQSALLQLLAERIARALADTGIRSTILKGPPLSEALYGDPGRRLSSDIDLLVDREHLNEAAKLVQGLGYAAPTDHVEDHGSGVGLPLLHFALAHRHGELPSVELHWRIHWYEERFARERLLPPNGDFAPGRRPAPADELAALLLFYARDGFIDLRHATDIGACWDAFGEDLPEGVLGETIRAYPALERVLMAALGAAERTVGLPAHRLLGRGEKLGRRERMAVRLANLYPNASEAQLYADMGLIDGLLTPPGGFFAFFRRQVLPPREVVQERARRAQGRRVSSPSGYGVRVLLRYVLAMSRLLRPSQMRCAPGSLGRTG